MPEVNTTDEMKLHSMKVKDQIDPRYAVGAAGAAQAASAKTTEEEQKASEIAVAMAGEEGADVATKIKKKKKKAVKSVKAVDADDYMNEEEGGDLVPALRSPPSPVSSHPPGGGGASVTSHRSFRSIDPDATGNYAIGEVWEAARPPGLVQDGGTDHGFFYIPDPASSDVAFFKAFLNNQKYTTRASPCDDWRTWTDDNPRVSLIHLSDVPRQALEKGRHLLAVRPGSAFFSQAQLSIDEFGDSYDDSGSYAQMFALQPARGADVDGSFTSDRNWQRRSRGGGGAGGGGGGYVASTVNPYSSVSFLRKGFTQNIVAGMVAFTGPGLFNAMQGLGNAGGSDPKVAATMNAVLYATFSIFGVLSGSLFNLLGTKILMSFGALTYAFYAISVYLWGQVDDSYAALAIVSSAVLGLGAACLWGAQGTMTLSYAMENQKGLFFGIFWLIFNMGGVMGGFITLGVNSGPADERASSVTPSTYFTFCVLMVAGSVFAFFFVIRPSSVVKADGSPVEFEKTESAEGLGELKEVAKLFTNRYMLLLTPLIIQSNWFYAYEFGGINGLLFDAPTRGLNSAIYWGISGISSYVGGTYYLDREDLGGRRHRAIRGLALISAINIGQWIYAIVYQFGTGYDKGNAPDPRINYRDGSSYAAPMILFMYCGLADSLVQTYAYWIIGAISNSPKTLSRYVGYYKGIQSFGGCLSWIIEAEGTSYRAQLMICSALAVIFIPPTYMVATCIQDKGDEGETEDLVEGDGALRRDRYADGRGYAQDRGYMEASNAGRKKKPARIV